MGNSGGASVPSTQVADEVKDQLTVEVCLHVTFSLLPLNTDSLAKYSRLNNGLKEYQTKYGLGNMVSHVVNPHTVYRASCPSGEAVLKENSFFVLCDKLEVWAGKVDLVKNKRIVQDLLHRLFSDMNDYVSSLLVPKEYDLIIKVDFICFEPIKDLAWLFANMLIPGFPTTYIEHKELISILHPLKFNLVNYNVYIPKIVLLDYYYAFMTMDFVDDGPSIGVDRFANQPRVHHSTNESCYDFYMKEKSFQEKEYKTLLKEIEDDKYEEWYNSLNEAQRQYIENLWINGKEHRRRLADVNDFHNSAEVAGWVPHPIVTIPVGIVDIKTWQEQLELEKLADNPDPKKIEELERGLGFAVAGIVPFEKYIANLGKWGFKYLKNIKLKKNYSESLQIVEEYAKKETKNHNSFSELDKAKKELDVASRRSNDATARYREAIDNDKPKEYLAKVGAESAEKSSKIKYETVQNSFQVETVNYQEFRKRLDYISTISEEDRRIIEHGIKQEIKLKIEQEIKYEYHKYTSMPLKQYINDTVNIPSILKSGGKSFSLELINEDSMLRKSIRNEE